MANENDDLKKVEEEAIAAEESYKKLHGHYREGSIYKKAQEEKERNKNLGTKANPIGKNAQMDPEEEKQAIEAEKSWARNHSGKYRQSSAWLGVRKDLTGKVIGEYNMKNCKK